MAIRTIRLPLLAALVLAATCGITTYAVSQPALSESAIREFVAGALDASLEDIQIKAASGIARPVTKGDAVVAYLGSTWQISRTAGYSGQPVDVMVLVGRDAIIRGTRLLAQQEPVLTIGILPQQIESFIDGFAGYDLREPVGAMSDRRTGEPDAIAGATISSGVIRSGIIRTARVMAEMYGLLSQPGGARIAMDAPRPFTWQQLADMEAIASLHVTISEADDALGVASNAERAGKFIDLHVAILDPPSIGVNLLGEAEYSTLLADLPVGAHALLIAANGLYSFKGTAWRKTGVFERIQLAQGERTITLAQEMHRSPHDIQAAGAPGLREKGIFILPADSNFNPAEGFRLSLLATRDDPQGRTKQARFTLEYALPTSLLVSAPVVTVPDHATLLWQANWRARIAHIVVVATMLLALYLILIFQNQIARRQQFYAVVRLSYLCITVVLLGFLIGAQLSVVQVLKFLQAIRSEFSWEHFLLDPVVFIIWAWVAVALLFWGRVYCGWLCPFGALQELLNKAARYAGIRQLEIPFALHERLWPLKYIIFLGLFAISLASMPMAFRFAEVEPFKTVVTLRFMREWPFIAYALSLLLAGLFIERFFCRYLCPLGAALAIPARLRMFEWLKRRPQCGKECRICAAKCPIQAIHPEGQINPNECIYCINCQTLYHNKHVCPPLKARAARRASVLSSKEALQ